jgi:Na+-driven multidrug efflux pump
MRVTKNLTNANIYKNYFLYALPLILSSILSSLYSTVDAVIAGKFISEHALGAISATSSYDILFQSFFNGFSCGFSVYIAQLFGKGDRVTIKRSIVDMLSFVAIVSTVVSILSIVFRAPIFDYLNIDPVLRRDAELYFIIYTAGYVFNFVNMILLRALYALGVTAFSIYATTISALLNILGNLLTVLVLDWGITGLALSTVVSILSATVIYATTMRRAFKELSTERISYRFSIKYVRLSLSYTIPAAIQKLAFHATGIFIAPAINGLGADATTGYSVMTRTYNLCAQSFWNTCSAVDCHTAQCVGMGEGETKRLRHGLWAGLWMNALMLSPFVLLFVFFAEPITSIFFPSDYVGPAFTYAVRFFHVYAGFLYINMIGHLMHSYMRSIGRVYTVLWITLFGSTVRVAATLLLVPLLHMDGVYIGQVLSWAADGALSVILYYALYHSERQIRKIIRKMRERT